MRDRRLLGLCGLLFSIVLASISPFSVSAATHTTFGAKLTHSTQATNTARCDNNSGISSGATCTWVATQAFENGGHQRAPKDGTIHKVKLISCDAGSFTVQVAQAKPSQHKAKVVRNGLKLSYVADNQSGGCGGPDGTNYKIQSFNVSFHVSKGDYIAVKARSVGFMHSSSSGDTLLFDPPLVPGGSFKTANSGENDMLIQFQY